MVKKENYISKKISFALFSIFFFIGVLTVKDYGVAGDEEFHRWSGFYWLNYILNFTSFEELNSIVTNKLKSMGDYTLPTVEDNPFYGVIFDLPLALMEILFGIEDPKNYFYLRHLLNFCLFFVGTIFFYKLLLNRFSNYSIALIGTLFFVLSPRIYAHSFFNTKDIVFLSLLSIALYYCFKTIEKESYKNLLIFSFFAAICTSSRILGIFLPVSFVIFYALSFLSGNRKKISLIYIILFCLSYYIFLIIFWPVLWSNPIENFFLAFGFFNELQDYNLKMLFNGEYISPRLLPYNYIFTWVLITTPMLYIILFIFGYIQIFRRFFLRFVSIKEKSYHQDLWRGSNEKKDLFILFSLTSIILYFITFNVLLYTGWRQIYFINIFIIYIAIYAFYQIEIYLRSKSKKKIQYGIVVIFLIFIMYKMFAYHPYQNLYFNSFFKPDSENKFEIDYWGLSGNKFLKDVLILENDKSAIKIGVASLLPLQRMTKLLDKEDRKKILIVGQNFQEAEYIFTNFISEVDKNVDDKYKIPTNFTKINEFILDDIKIYEVYKKNN